MSNWVLYAYTDEPVFPAFGLESEDRYEQIYACHPTDYRTVSIIEGTMSQALEQVYVEYLRCSTCRLFSPIAAAVEGICPSCRYEAVKKAGGDVILGMIAANAWADAWRDSHHEIVERWRIVVAVPRGWNSV